MKLTIISTDVFEHSLGSPCRIWEGTDGEGTKYQVYVRAIAPANGIPDIEAVRINRKLERVRNRRAGYDHDMTEAVREAERLKAIREAT